MGRSAHSGSYGSGQRVGAVDVGRLGPRAGHRTPEEMWSLDEALLTVLGLD
jgi:hypothetical protein